MKKISTFTALLLFVFVSFFSIQNASADPEKRVMVQAFWWDYWHGDYPNSYANYLAELAPRLRDAGVNAVWVPPFVKNTGTNSVGYSPYDHYDLGDKFQKGSATTRFGTKDEVLRMIAIMHANGIEVIEDVVLNHADGAGKEDPSAWDNKWKLFRYACYETPEGSVDYTGQKGRWFKNWSNFHPNEGHNCNDGDWCSSWWGPDICYYEGAYGQASQADYNPEQGKNYNRDNARNWLMWMKKQTGVDGFRWDAVKHFPVWAQQDFLWNVKYSLPDWSQGGNKMLSFGEYVGSASEMDNYCYEFGQHGDELMQGTFDFSLRNAVKSMASGGGFSDIGGVPGQQQSFRFVDYESGRTHRSVSFVNGHDTFRPKLDENGNYIGWDDGQEIGGHLDPFSSRLGAAYAIIAAMDGNPCFYMEDLFNLSNGKRYTHDPKNEEELPMRDALKNIMWCHQNLGFKYGGYRVYYQDGDLLVLARAGKAIIPVTDNGSTDIYKWISVPDFAPGTVLKDYSGSFSHTITVNNDRWVEIAVTKADGGKGYAVWAPEGNNGGYAPYRSKVTVQEWEMANDLGDRHDQSLGQGGALPANSTNQRVVGKIYVKDGTEVKYNCYLEKDNNEDVTVALYTLDGDKLSTEVGTKDFDGTWTATYTGWVTAKIWSNTTNNEQQKAWVRLTYEAPTEIDNAMADNANTRASVWHGNENEHWADTRNWEQAKVPGPDSRVVIPDNGDRQPVISEAVTIRELIIENGVGSPSAPDLIVNNKLIVTSNSTANAGTAFICGTGSSSLGNQQGNFDTCLTTGVDSYLNGNTFEIKVYPNPVDDFVNVRLSSNQTNKVELFDISGREVFNTQIIDSKDFKIDMSELASGVYIIKIDKQSARIIKK